jgi:hypothetical protein
MSLRVQIARCYRGAWNGPDVRGGETGLGPWRKDTFS